jgi:uncharacterized membrane protein
MMFDTSIHPSQNRLLLVCVVGFTVVVMLNLFGLLALKQPAAHFFSVRWWSVWFPSYVVWLVIASVGVGRQLIRR